MDTDALNSGSDGGTDLLAAAPAKSTSRLLAKKQRQGAASPVSPGAAAEGASAGATFEGKAEGGAKKGGTPTGALKAAAGFFGLKKKSPSPSPTLEASDDDLPKANDSDASGQLEEKKKRSMMGSIFKKK